MHLKTPDEDGLKLRIALRVILNFSCQLSEINLARVSFKHLKELTLEEAGIKGKRVMCISSLSNMYASLEEAMWRGYFSPCLREL